MHCHYTPHQHECVSVLPLSWTNRQTYGPESQHVGQVEGCLGQDQRSKVKVTSLRNILREFQVPKIQYGCRMGKVLQQEAHSEKQITVCKAKILSHLP